MGLRQALVRLDEAVLPRLARGAARVGSRLRGRRPRPLTVAASLAVIGVAAALLLQNGHTPAPVPNQSIRVGISDGASIPDYLTRARLDLADLATTAPSRSVYALVSFSAYLDPDQVAAVVAATVRGGGELSTIAALARVPLPHRQTELVRLPANRVPADLLVGMAEVADRKSRQAGDYAVRASAAPSGSRAGLATSAEIASAEAGAYRADCACVYALVVRGLPAVLTRLAHQVDVRGVQPAPELADTAGVVFSAPLPEQTDRVTPPDDGPG